MVWKKAAKEYTTDGGVFVTMYAVSKRMRGSHYPLHTFHNTHKVEMYNFRRNEVSCLFWGGREGGRLLGRNEAERTDFKKR